MINPRRSVGILILAWLCLAATAAGPDRFPVPHRLMVTKEDLKEFSKKRLVALMGHELPWTRLAAAQVLADEGGSSVPIFLTLLTHKDWRVVRAAQDGLIVILATAKKSNDDSTRKAVVRAMPELKKTLANKHYYVRMGALDCFRAMGADAKVVINDICVCFNDEDFLGVAPKAAAVVRAIGVENIDPKVLMPVLKEAVRSNKVSIRRPAINLIAKLNETQQRTLISDMLYALKTPMPRHGFASPTSP
jgi:hypothetical protein